MCSTQASQGERVAGESYHPVVLFFSCAVVFYSGLPGAFWSSFFSRRGSRCLEAPLFELRQLTQQTLPKERMWHTGLGLSNLPRRRQCQQRLQR